MRSSGGQTALGLTVLILSAGAALADPATVTPDPPTSDGPQLRPFCTDRPTKSNGACTVDAGHFQVEADLFDATIERSGEVTTDTYLAAQPTLKYGLTNTVDVEAQFTPFEEVRTRAAGTVRRLYGVGDLYLKAKVNLVGDDGGTVAATLYPYLKVPTARDGIGDGAWEGGLIVPVVIKLSEAVQLTFNPELDVTEDQDGSGHHLGTAQLIDLSWQLPKNVTVFGELWTDVDFDPQHTTTQFSADVAVAWQLPHDLQLDAGLNFGLNRETPDVQGYFGVSHRF